MSRLDWDDPFIFDEIDDRNDQHADYDYPELDPCPDPECDGQIILEVEKNYGADRDGNRGIDVCWRECSVCGEDPRSWEGEGE